MPEIDRRDFLRTGAVALLGAATPWSPPRPFSSSGRPTLVCVFLRGGLDGLSMIVPHGDARYYRGRPTIAVPAAQLLDLDGYVGLHPALARLKPWWDNRRLAVIPAAGFRGAIPGHVPAQQRVQEQLLSGPGRPARRFGSLSDVAHALRSRRRLETALVDSWGWDTHVGQGTMHGSLAARLSRLGAELAGFAAALGDGMRHVVILTVSEFGRTVRENRFGGTDHGHATASLVLGGAVHGGRVVGGWPDLDEADAVPPRTDLTDLVREIIPPLRPPHPGG